MIGSTEVIEPEICLVNRAQTPVRRAVPFDINESRFAGRRCSSQARPNCTQFTAMALKSLVTRRMPAATNRPARRGCASMSKMFPPRPSRPARQG